MDCRGKVGQRKYATLLINYKIASLKYRLSIFTHQKLSHSVRFLPSSSLRVWSHLNGMQAASCCVPSPSHLTAHQSPNMRTQLAVCISTSYVGSHTQSRSTPELRHIFKSFRNPAIIYILNICIIRRSVWQIIVLITTYDRISLLWT